VPEVLRRGLPRQLWELTPTGYDGAIGPALAVGAGAGAVAAVAAFFAPRRTRAPQV
jgi:hypothetical protein